MIILGLNFEELPTGFRLQNKNLIIFCTDSSHVETTISYNKFMLRSWGYSYDVSLMNLIQAIDDKEERILEEIEYVTMNLKQDFHYKNYFKSLKKKLKEINKIKNLEEIQHIASVLNIKDILE